MINYIRVFKTISAASLIAASTSTMATSLEIGGSVGGISVSTSADTDTGSASVSVGGGGTSVGASVGGDGASVSAGTDDGGTDDGDTGGGGIDDGDVGNGGIGDVPDPLTDVATDARNADVPLDLTSAYQSYVGGILVSDDNQVIGMIKKVISTTDRGAWLQILLNPTLFERSETAKVFVPGPANATNWKIPFRMSLNEFKSRLRG